MRNAQQNHDGPQPSRMAPPSDEAPAPLVLVLPLPPNLANDRTNWRVKNKERKRYFAQCDQLQLLKLIPTPPSEPWTPVVVHVTLYVGRRMDDDNAKYRGYKWPADWLRTRGYIYDDGHPHCRMAEPEQVVRRANLQLVLRVELTGPR